MKSLLSMEDLTNEEILSLVKRALDLKKGAEEALNKTVDGAKDLAGKAVDEAKKLGDSKVAQDIKKGAEDALNKTVDGAKDLK